MVSFIPRPLYLWEKIPGTHLVGSLVGPRAYPDILEERISSATSSRNGTKDISFCNSVTCNQDMKECEFLKSLWNQ